jgi:general secretion pathway protein D
VGEQLTVEIRVMGASNVSSIPFHLRYNQAVLEYTGPLVEGDFLRQDGASTVVNATPTAAAGEIVVGASRVGAPAGISGAGTLCSLTFVARAPGPANFVFAGAAVKDQNQNNLPASFSGTPVTVKAK